MRHAYTERHLRHRDVIWSYVLSTGILVLSTVGLDEHEIRQNVRDREKLQREQNQTEIDFA